MLVCKWILVVFSIQKLTDPGAQEGVNAYSSKDSCFWYWELRKAPFSIQLLACPPIAGFHQFLKDSGVLQHQLYLQCFYTTFSKRHIQESGADALLAGFKDHVLFLKLTTFFFLKAFVN